MINKKIGLLQISTLAFFLTTSSFILFFEKIIRVSKSDTIISIIIGCIFDLLLFKVILWGRKKIKFNNKIANIFLMIVLTAIFIYLLINSTNFIKTSFLASGNFYSIIILLFLMCLITSNKSYKEISSLSLILFFIFIPLFIINIIGSTFSLDSSYLMPPFATSFGNIIMGAALFIIYTMLPLLLLLFIPYNEIDNRKKQDKYLYLALTLGFLVIIIQYLLLYFSCSINIITSYNYPYMLVINSLSSSFILGRFSYIISFYLLFSLVITLSLILTIIKHLFLDMNNLRLQD